MTLLCPLDFQLDQNLPSLCAAELGVTEGTEAEPRTGWCPLLIVLQQEFLLDVVGSLSRLENVLDVLKLLRFEASLPLPAFSVLQTLVLAQTKCIDPANILFVNWLRGKTFLTVL